MEETHHEHEAHSGLLWHELLHHLPYAIFSVAISLVVLSFVSVSGHTSTADALFHNFHFLHIVFAATGTVITFMRFSRSVVKALLVGICAPAIFCSLSDAVLPYYGGRLLGMDMHWHLCFYSELRNVLPFLIVGVLNGFVMGKHHYSRLASFSVSSHFVHILVSSMAASMYLMAHGFDDMSAQIGTVFIFLIVAVLVPCTVSDVIVPLLFAGTDKRT